MCDETTRSGGSRRWRPDASVVERCLGPAHELRRIDRAAEDPCQERTALPLQLVALLLHRRYREDPEVFVPRYLDFLGAGGSASPAAQLEPFGLDLRSADTWREAFAELDSLRSDAEEQLAALG